MAYLNICFRPTKRVADVFGRLAREEGLTRSELAREVFEAGLKSVRERKALEEFYAGRTSFLKAAHEAGVSAYEFLELLKATKRPFIEISQQELKEELKAATKAVD